MHAVFGFQDVRRIKTVFTPRTGYDAIIRSILLAVLVAKLPQLLFAIKPINAVSFALGKFAGITNSVVAKIDCGLLSGYGVLEFDRRIWALIGYYALFAICNRLRQAIECFWPRVVCSVKP